MRTASERLEDLIMYDIWFNDLTDYQKDALADLIKEYALEVAKEALKNASENFDIDDIEVTEGGIVCYDLIQTNILLETNIPELK